MAPYSILRIHDGVNVDRIFEAGSQAGIAEYDL